MTKDEIYELLIDNSKDTPRVSLNDILKQEEQSKLFNKIMNDLDDSDGNVRVAAIRYPNATKEHIDKALNDPSWYVRCWAIHHPNATKEHIDKALNDSDNMIRKAAKERLKE